MLTTSLFLIFLSLAAGDKLVWQDEFNTLDQNQWTHLITAWRGGENQFQFYRNNRKNSYVRNGILYIKPTFTVDEHNEDFLYHGSLTENNCNFQPCTSTAGQDIVLPVQSARIRSKYGFKYGRLEVRAKMPSGDWLWPAIWLMPKDSKYGVWPRSGEIDMVECRSNKNYTDAHGTNEGPDRFSSTLHFGTDKSHDNYGKARWEKNIRGSGRDLTQDFHIYGLEWSDKHLEFTFDGQTVGNINAPSGGFWKLGGYDKNPGGTNIWQNGNGMAPFDQEFQIILNVAVGGYYFPTDYKNSPHPRPWSWSSSHPIRDFWEKRSWWQPTWNGENSAMQIDYVRVYQ